MRKLARAFQILLGLAGMDGHSLWTASGPSRRASWVKGYIRRPTANTRRRPASPINGLSHREKTTLLVAFDLWNGSGDVLFADVLGLSPRLVRAIAGFMECRAADTSDAIDLWITRWSAENTPG